MYLYILYLPKRFIDSVSGLKFVRYVNLLDYVHMFILAEANWKAY